MKTILILFFILQPLLAEQRPTTSDPTQYASQGTIAFSSSGAAYLPTNVVSATANGTFSPYVQLALQQHMMNQCLKNVLARTPAQRDSYVRAKALFEQGICQLARCYQQMMIFDLLAQSSSNPQNGGTSDPQMQQGYEQAAVAMINALAKQGSCETGSSSAPSSQNPSVDPYLQQFATSQLQTASP